MTSLVLLFAASGILEAGLTGGFSDGPGYAGRAPATGISVNVGSRHLRLLASASGSLVHKSLTPGGYSLGANGGVELRFGRVFLRGGATTSYTDQTIWTKRVRYAYGGAGMRVVGRSSMTDLGFVYYRETFSTYANHARVFDFQVTSDLRLGNGPWCVRLAGSLGPMFFDDNPYPGAAKRRGLTANIGIGLAFRP